MTASKASPLWRSIKFIGGAAAVWGMGRALLGRSAPSKAEKHAAAFCDHETDSENISQTRSAGPDAMRDPVQRPWERVDQAVDESFPASDPPAY
ncbi:hypothetical protein [Sphingopyxis sp. MWB1]|uniref:hypothetical protein n=1 Tax=Sphingopyxis sp. MWB1 TaxID=1537715 RepID=UPI00051A251F|nr:hypothetical protein [Sphingopyxis sp. MWB1]